MLKEYRWIEVNSLSSGSNGSHGGKEGNDLELHVDG
jgi:hypothetical protein